MGAHRPHALLLGGLGCVLAWLVVSHSLVAYLGAASPHRALLIAPGSATALLRAAELELAPWRERATKEQEYRQAAVRAGAERAVHGSDGRLRGSGAARVPTGIDAAGHAALDRVAARARAALSVAPLSVSGLRLLGEVAALKGDRRAAEQLNAAAASRWHHEQIAVLYMMMSRLEAQDHHAAVEHFDTLLRTNPGLWNVVAPVLARILESGSGARHAIEKLAADPPWRSNLVEALPAAITDARTLVAVLQGLKEAGRPLSQAEAASYVAFLVTNGFYEVAQYAWLQLIPPEQLAVVGLLQNGDFAQPLSGMPFDWALKDGSGAKLEIVGDNAQIDSERGLKVELGPGRVQFGQVMQWLALAPGTYWLAGSWRGDIKGQRGLRWQIVCMDKGERKIAESAMMLGAQQVWLEIETVFDVPRSGCRGQQIRLVLDARYSAEQLVSGIAWISDIGIRRHAERN